ncbi:MAG: type II toxin-antitoxin system VapC family toxin [Chthoniobacterales bacterium]|nr:type II toxin-antitoxin system VapC family toxin [Chthoniobacterales bacterium]
MIRALDTNVIVDILRGRDEALMARYIDGRPSDYAVPEMVRAELLFGASVSARPRENQRAIGRFLAPLRLLPFSGAAAEHWAEIRRALHEAGTPIGPNDLVIAATARAAGCTLVTRNTREFTRVSALAVEVW